MNQIFLAALMVTIGALNAIAHEEDKQTEKAIEAFAKSTYLQQVPEAKSQSYRAAPPQAMLIGELCGRGIGCNYTYLASQVFRHLADGPSHVVYGQVLISTQSSAARVTPVTVEVKPSGPVASLQCVSSDKKYTVAFEADKKSGRVLIDGKAPRFSEIQCHTGKEVGDLFCVSPRVMDAGFHVTVSRRRAQLSKITIAGLTNMADLSCNF